MTFRAGGADATVRVWDGAAPESLPKDGDHALAPVREILTKAIHWGGPRPGWRLATIGRALPLSTMVGDCRPLLAMLGPWPAKLFLFTDLSFFTCYIYK